MSNDKYPAFTVANCVVMKWSNPIFARMGIYQKESQYYYHHFTEYARQFNINIFRADYRWYDFNTGLFKKAWVYDHDNGWQRAFNLKADIVHDLSVNKPKLMPIKKFFSDQGMFAANPYELELLLVDKYQNYQKFQELYPATYLINNRQELLANLEKISSDQVVIKPREGSSAKNVNIVSKQEALELEIPENYLLQEFIVTPQPVQDFRVVYANGKILHYYTRVAAPGSLFSNFSRGAKMQILKTEQVPQAVHQAWEKIAAVVDQYPFSMLTADFMLDLQGRAYLIEMNSKPGKVIYRPNGEMEAFKQIMQATIENYQIVYKLKYQK